MKVLCHVRYVPMMGMMKARVFPEPVLAAPKISKPLNAKPDKVKYIFSYLSTKLHVKNVKKNKNGKFV